jgi:hypothetical protein
MPRQEIEPLKFDVNISCEEMSSEEYFQKKVKEIENEQDSLSAQLDRLLDSPYNNCN